MLNKCEYINKFEDKNKAFQLTKNYLRLKVINFKKYITYIYKYRFGKIK